MAHGHWRRPTAPRLIVKGAVGLGAGATLSIAAEIAIVCVSAHAPEPFCQSSATLLAGLMIYLAFLRTGPSDLLLRSRLVGQLVLQYKRAEFLSQRHRNIDGRPRDRWTDRSRGRLLESNATDEFARADRQQPTQCQFRSCHHAIVRLNRRQLFGHHESIRSGRNAHGKCAAVAIQPAGPVRMVVWGLQPLRTVRRVAHGAFIHAGGFQPDLRGFDQYRHVAAAIRECRVFDFFCFGRNRQGCLERDGVR